jgi:hypothetical protein
MWFKNLVRGMNPWLPAFAVNILFQFQRHAPVDGIIFSISAFLMILDWKNLLPIHFGPRPVFRLRYIIAAIGLSATVLYLAPRHSLQDALVLISVIPIAVMLVYYEDERQPPFDARIMRRTTSIYVWLGLFLVIVELAAYVISDRIQNSSDFPTISFMISPTLEFPAVRFLFLVIWMSMGVGLMQVMRGRKVVEAVEHTAEVKAAVRDAVANYEDSSSYQDEIGQDRGVQK